MEGVPRGVRVRGGVTLRGVALADVSWFGGWKRPRLYQETLTCPCGLEGHADLVASRTLLGVVLDALRPGSGSIATVPIDVAPTSAQWRIQPVSLHCAAFDVTLEDGDDASRPFLVTDECPHRPPAHQR